MIGHRGPPVVTCVVSMFHRCWFNVTRAEFFGRVMRLAGWSHWINGSAQIVVLSRRPQQDGNSIGQTLSMGSSAGRAWEDGRGWANSSCFAYVLNADANNLGDKASHSSISATMSDHRIDGPPASSRRKEGLHLAGLVHPYAWSRSTTEDRRPGQSGKHHQILGGSALNVLHPEPGNQNVTLWDQQSNRRRGT